MSNVIPIAAMRAERLKRALEAYGRNGEPVIVETRTAQIFAEKITCRGRFAEILNGFGDYFVIDYADIRSLRPIAVAQNSAVNAWGEFIPVHEAVASPSQVAVVPFVPRHGRR